MGVEEKKKMEKDILEIYTPLSIAKKEIWKRWKDKKLKKRVEEFLGDDIPSALRGKPKAVLTRNIASPNKEFIRFLDFSDLIGLKPRCLEYQCDKFRAENQDKYYLGKLFFFRGIGKKWGERVSTLRVINFNDSEGKKFAKIKTLWGENFVNFHHRLLKCSVNNCKHIISDESNWIKDNGDNPSQYYEKLLALFICHGVLFENYLYSEEHFVKKYLLPNLKKIKEKFKVKPLIVKLFPSDCDNELFWQYYPESLYQVVKNNK